MKKQSKILSKLKFKFSKSGMYLLHLLILLIIPLISAFFHKINLSSFSIDGIYAIIAFIGHWLYEYRTKCNQCFYKLNQEGKEEEKPCE